MTRSINHSNHLPCYLYTVSSINLSTVNTLIIYPIKRQEPSKIRIATDCDCYYCSRHHCLSRPSSSYQNNQENNYTQCCFSIHSFISLNDKSRTRSLIFPQQSVAKNRSNRSNFSTTASYTWKWQCIYARIVSIIRTGARSSRFSNALVARVRVRAE